MAIKKRCSGCKRALARSKFPKDKSKPDGLNTLCFECKKDVNKSPEQRMSDKMHKGKARAKRGGATKVHFNAGLWMRLRREQLNCLHCGVLFSKEIPPTLDHIVPLNRGGQHTRANIQLLCHSCNASKQDKLEEEL